MSKQEIKEATKRAMAAKKAATAAGPSGRKYDSVHKPAGAKIDLYPEAKLAFTQADGLPRLLQMNAQAAPLNQTLQPVQTHDVVSVPILICIPDLKNTMGFQRPPPTGFA